MYFRELPKKEGMTRTLYILVFWLFGGFGPLVQGSEPIDPVDGWSRLPTYGYFDSIADIVRALDPLKDQQWTPDLKEGYRTQLGTQFDLSCFKARSNRHKAFQEFEKITKMAASKMLLCGSQYPELKPLITQWIQAARRQKIDCKWMSQNGAVAHTLAGDEITFSKETIYLSGIERSASTFIHEVFHQSGGDNQNFLNHDKLERRALSMSCNNDPLLDRVTVLTTLCSHTGENAWPTDLLEDSYRTRAVTRSTTTLISDRIKTCGLQRGCVDVVMGKGAEIHNVFDWVAYNYYDHVSLTKKNAESLCHKIEDDGFCLKTRISQGQALSKSFPEINDVVLKIHKKISAILPTHENQIPAALLNQFPEQKTKLQILKYEPCFKSVFNFDEDGSLYVRKRKGVEYFLDDPIDTPSSLFKFEKFMALFFQNYIDQAVKTMQKTSVCQESELSKKIAGEIEVALTDLSKNQPPSVQLKMIENIIEYRETPNLTKLAYFPRKSIDISWIENTLEPMVGRDLLDEYFKTMDRYHYMSPYFDCEAAGLSPYRSAQRASKTLFELQTGLEQNSCQ